MPPKKPTRRDKGKEIAEPPPEKKLTNIRTWLQAAQTPPKPLSITTISNQVKEEPVSIKSSDNKPLSIDITQLTQEQALLLLQQAFNNQPQPSMALVSPDPSPLATQKAKGKTISSEVVIQSTQTIQPSQTSQSTQVTPPKSKFSHKTIFQNICNVENGFYNADPYVFAKNMFSENFFYTPHDVYKTSKFYEKILEETKSVYFRHFEDKGM